MITFSNSCDTYNAEVKRAKKLLSAKKLILILPTILLAILSIVLTIVFRNLALLSMVLAAGIYFFVMLLVISVEFSKLCGKIVENYCDFYKIKEEDRKTLNNMITSGMPYSSLQELQGTLYAPFEQLPASLCEITNDNQGFIKVIYTGNNLYAWTSSEALCFISAKPLAVNKLRLMKTSKDTFLDLIRSDFGCLIVPLKEIDHYRECVMVCSFGANNLCKFTFSDSIMLDHLIPRKDFYYQSKKKSELNI